MVATATPGVLLWLAVKFSTVEQFLNSIESPLQIVMNTDTIDLDDYFKSLSQRTQGYKELLNSHKKFLKNFVSDRGIMNRSFYIVIPESYNIDIQIKLVEYGFQQYQLAPPSEFKLNSSCYR